MNREELLAFHDTFTARMKSICVAKNQDYAGKGGGDPFANFRRVEGMGVASTEQGFLTRMIDKVSRLSSFVESGTLAVKDESATDTLVDLANYALLLAAYLSASVKPVPQRPASVIGYANIYTDGYGNTRAGIVYPVRDQAAAKNCPLSGESSMGTFAIYQDEGEVK